MNRTLEASRMLAFGWRMPGFLKLLLFAKSVCVCVSAPEAMYKLHSHDIEPVQPAEQEPCALYQNNSTTM